MVSDPAHGCKVPARQARRFGLSAVLLLVCAAPVCAAPAAGAAVRSEFFGIVQASTLDNPDLQGLQAVHVRTVRYLFPWYSVEPKNG